MCPPVTFYSPDDFPRVGHWVHWTKNLPPSTGWVFLPGMAMGLLSAYDSVLAEGEGTSWKTDCTCTKLYKLPTETFAAWHHVQAWDSRKGRERQMSAISRYVSGGSLVGDIKKINILSSHHQKVCVWDKQMVIWWGVRSEGRKRWGVWLSQKKDQKGWLPPCLDIGLGSDRNMHHI